MPLRTCVVCHEQRPKRELMRIVRTPEGSIEVDPKGKRPGRGAYVCIRPQCWNTALNEGNLGRALKCRIGSEDVAAVKASIASLQETEPMPEST